MSAPRSAWARGTQALIAYWSGQPRRAVTLVTAGIADAPTGPGRARLHDIEARAWAQLGNRSGVTDALHQADRAMDDATGTDDLIDDIGGEFGWGLSAHAACAGTALLGVGDADGAAVRRPAGTANATPPTCASASKHAPPRPPSSAL